MDSQRYITATAEAVQRLTSLVMNPNNKLSKDCIAKFMTAINQVMSANSQAAVHLASLEGENTTYKNMLTSKRDEAPAQPPAHIIETLSEMEDRRIRSKNVIMFEVPESSSDLSFNGMSEDMQSVANVMKEIEGANELQISRVYRLGRKVPDKVRPLKVEFKSSDQAKFVMMNKVKIPKEIRIKRDLTMCQRKEIADLWKEIEERRGKGEDNLTVRFVNSIPKITQAHHRSSKN
jgi:hypothetical protein